MRELIASGMAAAMLLNLAGPAAPRLAAQDTGQEFQIEIIQGANLVNSVKRRVASETIVEVHDRNRKPVAGVILTFTLPQTGAGGTFTGTGSNIATVTTGANGQATMPAMQANNVTGSYNISVSGDVNGSHVSTQIHVTNQPATTSFVHSTGFKVLLVAAAAGGAVGGILATRGGGSSKTTITPGTPSLGPASLPGH